MLRRQIIILMAITLVLAACTPASTQEEQAPTLTLSPTETHLPTETLTSTATSIPPTPTFPAPENADLPDSAVRSVNDQGQEVILDQPGGDVLWTLIEDKSGELEWQENLTELESTNTELQKKIEAHLKQQTAEAAQHLAAYLNKHVQGDVGYIDFHNEDLGDFEIGWHVEKQRWVRVTDDNREQIDFTLDTSFPPIFAPGRIDESGQDVFINLEGEEVVLERQELPFIGEVTLAEVILMGRKNELSYDGQTGLNLVEYVTLLMKEAYFPGPRGEEYVRNLIKKYSAPFVLATVLEQGYYFIDEDKSEQFTLVDKINDKIILPSIPTNTVLYPIVSEHQGQAKIVCWMRVVQGVGRFGFNNQFSIDDRGNNVVHDGAIREGGVVLGGSADLQAHPWAFFLQPGTQDESMKRTHTLPLFDQGVGVFSDELLKTMADSDAESILTILEEIEPRLIAFYSHQLVVKR